MDDWIELNLNYFENLHEAAAWLNKLTARNKIVIDDQEQKLEKLAQMAIEHYNKPMTGPETYKRVAEALPWEIQSALLSLRDCGDDTAAIEEFYYKIPILTYSAMIELCLITEWNEKTRSGMKLTTAGQHLVNYCTC